MKLVKDYYQAVSTFPVKNESDWICLNILYMTDRIT